MNIGDKVFIFDLKSDLYTRTGEVVRIEGHMAALMVRIRRGYIIDIFDLDKLYVRGELA
ncbi:hypothetical protein [Anaerosolibacter sp.]|uniref:hypothetical protein n=1 Tax=Anaerosolibacter sp. TaxID=1872527 RepID=UPI0039EF446E